MSDGITRRDASRMVAVVPLAAPAIVRAAPERLVFGLIGAGAWGQVLLGHANRIGSGHCAAICDVDEANLRKAAGLARDQPQPYSDYRQLLSRKDIQAVLVATPHYTHFPLTRDALLAGKHVQCEPPLAFKVEEIQALRDTASRTGRIVQVGLQRRYSRFYQTARQMAAKGFLGDITNIQAQWHRASERPLERGRSRESNWRFYREFSGGLTAELGSHQIDVASWMFNDAPEFVTGVGALDWKKDGRDVYDNVALILRYPEGRQMTWSAISTNKHLPIFGGARSEAGEIVMGTEGTIEITLGNQEQRAVGLWFYEPNKVKVSTAEAAKEIARVAGATVASTPGGGFRGLPILLDRDQITGDESFLQREMKYARRWLYAKGIMAPEEDRHPVTAELESFFECCREDKRPKADLEAGLANSAAVILANRAMDEGRRVQFGELERSTGKRP
ncbi:MAG: Gfo/Idh/MocA family oxidoreductase [Bryobacterales bacterium]|nr:Gfo/Idh/MocA family oxidoreductase [Bryobacterales bacterium]